MTVDEDVAAIRSIIERQFGSVGWTQSEPSDWEAFSGDFLEDARLFPAARPVAAKSVASFVERMKGLTGDSLHTFHERALRADILVFGNVAVALAGCEITENGDQITRGAEAILLVKTEGATWKIAAQAWDMESDDAQLPERLR